MHYAALHVELVREGWIESADRLVGYRAQAQIVKRRGPGRGQVAIITIEFGETVRARETQLVGWAACFPLHFRNSQEKTSPLSGWP